MKFFPKAFFSPQHYSGKGRGKFQCEKAQTQEVKKVVFCKIKDESHRFINRNSECWSGCASQLSS